MKIKNLHIVLLIFSSAFMACSSQKNVGNTGGLSYREARQFDQHYFDGARYKIVDDPKKALESFAAALKLDPNNAEVMYQIANIYYGLGQIEPAVEWAERSVENLKEFNYWYYGQLAQFYNKQGDFSSAAETFELMIKKEPDKQRSYIEAANQWLNDKNLDKALSILLQHNQNFGTNEDVARRLEFIYLNKGNKEKAVGAMKELQQTNPTELKYLALLAETYTKVEQLEDAEKTYLQMLEQDKSNGFAHFGLADIYKEQDKETESFNHLKQGFYDERIPIEKKLQIITSFYFLIKKEEKGKERAFQLGDAILETHPSNSTSYLVYADLLFAAEKIDSSRSYYLKCLELDPSEYKVWLKVFQLDEELKRFDWMAADTKKALEFFPNQVELYSFNSYAHLVRNEYKEVVEASEEGLLYALTGQQKADFYIQLGEAYHHLKEAEKSNKNFENALKIEPNNALVMNNYAYFLSLRSDNLPKAKELVEKALKIEPGSASYQDTYGWVLYQMGDFKGAENWVGKALETNPDNPELLHHMGDIQFRLGNVDKALQLWIKAKENGAVNPELENKIKTGKLDASIPQE